MPDLPVIDGVTIPEDELSWKFSTSGGPGGQHANRSATRAEVSFAVDSSRALSAPQKQRVAAELASRIRGGTLTVSADDTRSQARNRELARRQTGAADLRCEFIKRILVGSAKQVAYRSV